MMGGRPRDTPVSTFVVRLWPEWSEQGPAWRGHVVHLQSGQKYGFQDPAALLAFMRRIVEPGTGADAPAPPESG
jgi:hypothetical protein